jgi:predicted DNA-binding protein (MmcQ/YjbR family)
MSSAARTAEALRVYALGLPEAHEDFPWGERVAKVRGKVFVFFGRDPGADGGLGFSVKLPVSGPRVLLEVPDAVPTGYGLGKAGWVTLRFGPGEVPPLEVLQAWVEESYRAVAPKRLAARVPSKEQ